MAYKDAYYFSHDSNAKDDPKCVLLIEQLGLEGYGIYWVLIETLRDQPDYKYPLVLIPAIARRYNTTAEKMKTVILNYGLFSVDDNDFFSLSLIRRMENFEHKKEIARLAGKKSAEKRRMLNAGLTDVEQTLNKGSTSKEEESKEEESKVKESKEDENEETNPQQQQQLKLQSLIKKFNNNIHMITPVEYEKLQDWSKAIEPDAISYAIDEAVVYNKRSFSYIETILKSWTAQGYKTKQDVEEHLRLKKDAKGEQTYKKDSKPTFNNHAGHTYDTKLLKENLLKKARGEL